MSGEMRKTFNVAKKSEEAEKLDLTATYSRVAANLHQSTPMCQCAAIKARAVESWEAGK